MELEGLVLVGSFIGVAAVHGYALPWLHGVMVLVMWVQTSRAPKQRNGILGLSNSSVPMVPWLRVLWCPNGEIHAVQPMPGQQLIVA